MSDASEVKRWTFEQVFGSAIQSDLRRGPWIEAIDHDRIMAERDELWKRATKFVMPGEMDTGESIEHYIKTLEQANAELKAEVDKLTRKLNGQYKRNSKLVFDLARYAKVVEKLREQRDKCLEYVSFDVDIMDREIEAIEQGEGM